MDGVGGEDERLKKFSDLALQEAVRPNRDSGKMKTTPGGNHNRNKSIPTAYAGSAW